MQLLIPTYLKVKITTIRAMPPTTSILALQWVVLSFYSPLGSYTARFLRLLQTGFAKWYRCLPQTFLLALSTSSNLPFSLFHFFKSSSLYMSASRAKSSRIFLFASHANFVVYSDQYFCLFLSASLEKYSCLFISTSESLIPNLLISLCLSFI